MPDQRIIDYLTQNQGKYPVESLKQALVQNGFPQAEVEEAARMLAGGSPAPGAQPAPVISQDAMSPAGAAAEAGTDLVLAGRMSRLGAALIDGFLFMIPILFNNLMIAMLKKPGLAVVGGVLFIVILIVQLVLLTKRGQTIGKIAAGVKIVKIATGQNGGFVTNVLLRGLVNGLLGMIPFYALVDILFIFRGDRRCIHDFIAGTKVVQA